VDTATALIAENAAFAGLLRDADLSIQVPTCPEWTLEQLMRHIGRGDRWSAQIVAEKLTEPLDPRTVAGGKPPAGRDNETTWLTDGVRALIDAVEETGPQTPVWTFLGMRPAEWWIRRRLHDPAAAVDGITEYLERVMIRAAENDPAHGGEPLREGHRGTARPRP
jgi:uncharacterized protein (TIGR03083 family)